MNCKELESVIHELTVAKSRHPRRGRRKVINCSHPYAKYYKDGNIDRWGCPDCKIEVGVMGLGTNGILDILRSNLEYRYKLDEASEVISSLQRVADQVDSKYYLVLGLVEELHEIKTKLNTARKEIRFLKRELQYEEA